MADIQKTNDDWNTFKQACQNLHIEMKAEDRTYLKSLVEKDRMLIKEAHKRMDITVKTLSF